MNGILILVDSLHREKVGHYFRSCFPCETFSPADYTVKLEMALPLANWNK